MFTLLFFALIPAYAAIYAVQDYEAEQASGFLRRFLDNGEVDPLFKVNRVGVYFKKKGPWIYVLTDCVAVEDTGRLRRMTLDGVFDPNFGGHFVRLLYGFFASEEGLILHDQTEKSWIVLDTEGRERERWTEPAAHIIECGTGFMVWRAPLWKPQVFFCQDADSATWMHERLESPRCFLAINTDEHLLALFKDFDVEAASGTLDLLSWDEREVQAWQPRASACAQVSLQNQHMAWFEWMDTENFVAKPHLFRRGVGELLARESLAIAPHLVLTAKVLGCVTLQEPSHFSGTLRLFDLEFVSLKNFEPIQGVTPYFELDMAL